MLLSPTCGVEHVSVREKPNRFYFRFCARMSNFFQWADLTATRKEKEVLEGHPTRNADGYPMQGVDMVPERPQPPPSDSIPFDEALWNECQQTKILDAEGQQHWVSHGIAWTYLQPRRSQRAAREALFTLHISQDQSAVV